MKDTITEIKQNIYSKVFEVYDIFKEFFGEEHVDLQGIHPEDQIPDILRAYNISYEDAEECLDAIRSRDVFSAYILVWWPEVTITNEFGKSVDIKNLYAKIKITAQGRIPWESSGFALNRSHYPKNHFIHNYMHSHVQDIPIDNFTKFQSPCLGTGPINNTIATLKDRYDEAMWMLFCQELDLYVQVESISGHPWHRLERLSSTDRMNQVYFCLSYLIANDYYNFKNFIGKEHLSNFIKYYLEKYSPFIEFQGDSFTWGTSSFETLIGVSNAFIEYFNSYIKDAHTKQELFNKGFLFPVLVDGIKLFTKSTRSTSFNISEYIGKLVCRFKGNDVLLEIDDEEQIPENSTVVLKFPIVCSIVSIITEIVNFRYGKRNNNQEYSEKVRILCPADS